MNQKLQNILDIIQQSEKLDAEQKDKLLKALKDADKELEITAFKLERTEKVKKTTAILLEETIEELEQKRKAVEAQNRELEIQTALERVRAIALSMKESADMLKVCRTISNELKLLNVKEIRNVQTAIIYESKGTYLNFEYYAKHNKEIITEVDFSIHHLQELFVNQMLKGTGELFSKTLQGKEVKDWYDHQKTTNQFADTYLEIANSLTYYWYSLGPVALGISTYEPLRDEEINLFKRFRNVFELAYRRFLDIEKVMAQAREAQIEAALERVRSRTMGMQKSEELQEVIKLVYEQFVQLKINVDHAGFVVDYTPKGDWHFWIADERDIPSKITHPYFDSVWASQFDEAKEKGIDFFETNLNFEEKNKFYNELLSHVPDLPQVSKDFYLNCPGLAATTVLFDDVSLYIENFSGTSYSDAENKILIRFGKVFQQTYTRFLDLQKAEAQAREAQIEASLEKVRAVAMSMNRSEDLLSICEASFKEFKKLGFDEIRNALIHIQYDEQKYFMDYDFSDLTGGAITKIEYGSHPIVEDYLKQIRSAKDAFYQGVIKEDQLEEWKNFRRNSGQIEDPRLEKATALYYYFFSIGIGDIGISTLQPIDESQIKILKRFRNVFDLAYRRYNDIALAEEQARETQIQLALERVRAKAMAMHSSKDLAETIGTFYTELKSLGVTPRRCGVALINQETRVAEVSTMNTTEEGDTVGVIGKIKMSGHLILENIYDNWIIQKEYHTILRGNQIKEYYQVLKPQITYPDYPNDVVQYGYYFMFKEGDVYAWTDKELVEEELKIFRRFTTVISLTYKRYMDLQQAEEQVRESQVQLALERVRARTMAMHKSEELSETSFVLFKQLEELGEVADQISIMIYNEKEKVIELYATIYGNQWNETGRLPLEESSVHKKIFAAWQERRKSIVIDLSGNDLHEFNNFKMKYSKQYKSESELPKKRWVVHNAFFSKGVLTFSTHEPRPAETIHLLERFAGVFDLTYTRFLDLQKAEAQAREAEIEAALERVRSRTMAMQKSIELAETASHFFEQLNSLGIKSYRFNIAIVDVESEKCRLWSTTNEGKVIPTGPLVPLKEHNVFNQMYDGWKQQQNVKVIKLHGEERIAWTKYIMRYVSFNEYKPENIDLDRLRNEPAIFSNFFFKQGFVVVHTIEEIIETDIKIIQRFVNVFEQTYTRFLDLNTAEAQAREAEIQLALERVRARTMAMHKSYELAEVAKVLFDQMSLLDNTPDRFNIRIINEAEKAFEFWATDQQGNLVDKFFKANFDESPIVQQMYTSWKAKEKILIQDIHGDQLSEWVHYIKDVLGVPFNPQNLKEHRFLSSFFFSHGMIGITTNEAPNLVTLKLIERFTIVFEQTYTRFLDLKKAEAQAREAQIEAALERVRAKAMAMHSSNDLSDTMGVLFTELPKLGISSLRCGVVLFSKDSTNGVFYAAATTQESDSFTMIGSGDMTKHPVFMRQYESWLQKENYFVTLGGEELQSYYKEIFARLSKTYNPKEHQLQTEHGYYFSFSEGMFYAWSEEPYSEEVINILNRFNAIINLTFRRYLDIQKAEAQAKEAIKQASLDRIRGEIASMRTSEDLNHITPIIWRELKNLEVPFFRCGVYIVDEKTETVQVYLTTPDGKSLGVLNLSFDSNKITSNTVDHWRKKIVYKTHWDREEFIEWTTSMMKLGQIQSAETYQGSAEPPESLDLHFVPFAQGMLYVGDVQPLTDEKLQLVKTLAEAFSIAYARYEDFKNLEAAKNKIEITLNELKSAQAQLVHSEKMASLGELTAGIAHEIKNPLNFVNNFSEVSRELLDEMKIEIENKNIDEVIELIEDLKQNLDKINQHGKRADSIVKGMLLHSRGSSGEKSLTDINDLLDQYINLAYHGMRAQNKEFNITIERDYDETLEKINVVPQDISRVFLNIINNACYAAYDKKKKNSDYNFSPTLKVSTKNLNDKVEIRIADNGDGIPKDILDKIFQPFFTTKPTGEGTGLGLSLSYDIVTKVHSGDLKVETKENEGSKFIIQLPL